jgi:hypothetical protein
MDLMYAECPQETGGTIPPDFLEHNRELGEEYPQTFRNVLENVEFVMKEGKVYKQSGKSACSQE